MPFPIAAAAIGAGGSIAGQILANNANKDLQQSANDTSIRLAAENRAWQEMMANTAHQREVRDLKAAGLNPILSATGGSGSATPSGSVASVGAARVEDAVGKGISSALSAAQVDAQMRSTEADIALKDASVANQAAQTAQSISSARKIDAETTNQHQRNVMLQYEAPAAKSRYELEDTQNVINKKAATYDAIMNRAEQATGMVGNLMPGIKALRSGVDSKTRDEHRRMKDFLNKKYGGD